MSNTNLMIAAALILIVFGIVLMLLLAYRRKNSDLLQKQFGTEYDHTVNALGDEKKAQTALKERQKHIAALDIRPLTVDEQSRYLTEWAAIQTNFVDEPGKSVVDADRLIMEVMQLRNYPVSDFEQRAADVSVSYPTLVTNYRAARVIALKNQQNLADTEELRQAMMFYHPLFEELLETEAVVA